MLPLSVTLLLSLVGSRLFWFRPDTVVLKQTGDVYQICSLCAQLLLYSL